MTPMDFASAGARVRELVAAKKPHEGSRSVLGPDELRDNVIREEAAESARFTSAQRQQPKIRYKDADGNKRSYDWTTFPEMIRDVARANWQLDEPELRPAGDIKPSHLLNREVGQQWLASEGFRESRPYTRGNGLESWYGAMAGTEKLAEFASGALAEHIARSEQMAEQEQIAQTADEMMENLRQRAKAQQAQHGQVDPATAQQLRDAAKARGQANQQLQNLLQQHKASNVVADVAQAVGQAAQAASDAADLIGNLPGTEPGNAHNIDPDKQIELAKRWQENPQLQEIAKMAGRLVRDMRFKREVRSKNVPIEPVGVTTGRDIGRMLPHELARAYDPAMRPIWMRDYAQRSLLEYEMGGKTRASKGPGVVPIDGSGSMAGEKFIWASALALALLMLFHREKRDFAGIEFGSASELKTWFFPKAQPLDPELVLDYASHFFGGGTDTTIGMAEALRIIEDVPDFKTADVILIADGQDHYGDDDEKIRKALVDQDVRIHGLSILAPNNTYMATMCEYVEDVADLAGSNNATDRLAEDIT